MSSNDSEKIVPPKKSKAARKTEEKKDEVASNHEGEEADKLDENEAEKNIFNEEPILEGKRKRNSPLSEQFSKEWLNTHLVESEATMILFTSDIYKCYVESCTSNGGVPLVEGEFLKILQATFPIGYKLSPDCPYKDSIRKKKKVSKNSKVVQAESLQLKMKDIIMEAIMSLGNPRRGVSMNTMRNYAAGKYPALRLDQREGVFKKAVNNQLRYKKIECVRGIGACGFYRMPRTPEEEAEEIAKEKQEAKLKLVKKKEKLEAIKKKREGKEEDAVDGETKAEGAEEEDGSKSKKADDAEEGDEEEEGGGDADVVDSKNGDAADEEKPDAKKVDKKKKKKKAKKAVGPSQKEYLDFENPARIEDTFPLAMTYNCEPKEASIVKISKYVIDFYQQDLTKDKLKKCLETGIEKGYWTQVSGTSSASGTYRLAIEEYDPNADKELTGMVMNAIVACTEPKVSSAFLLKKYILVYHPELKVVEHPRRFKQALQRAAASNKIRQLSGIGATGSFQLLGPFRPSPSILQGKGSMGWPMSSKDSDNDDDTATDVEGDGGVELYQDAYKPRPSKRRGMGRATEATRVSRLDLSLYPPSKKSKSDLGSNGLTAKRSALGRNRLSANNPRKSVKRPPPSEEDEEEEEEEEEEDDESEEQEFVPKKMVSRGSGKKTVKAAQSVKSSTANRSGAPKAKKAKISSGSKVRAPAASGKLEPRKAKKQPTPVEVDKDDEDEEDAVEEEEEEVDEVELDEDEFVSKKSQSKGSNKKNAKTAKSAAVNKSKASKGKKAKSSSGDKSQMPLPSAKLEPRAAKRKVNYVEAKDSDEDNDAEQHSALNMACSPRKATLTPKRMSGRSKAGKSPKLSGDASGLQDVSIVLEREIEGLSPKNQKNVGKGGALAAASNGKKASPAKENKTKKKKSRGRY